jgi:hypothetical protein
VIQIAHWLAFRLRPQLRFRRNVLVGHVLVFIGELSLFYINALAVVILFDRGAELDFVVWKILLNMERHDMRALPRTPFPRSSAWASAARSTMYTKGHS